MTEVSRIEKIVQRSKADAPGEKGKSPLGPARYRQATGPTGIEYTETRVVNVAKSTLEAKRVVAADPDSPYAASFQILRTKVLQQMRKSGWTTIGISSPSAGAGKSLVAANLAVSMATEGNQSVLLVDMDLRRPSIHDYFGFTPEWGVSDIIGGNATVAETLVNPGIERLVILPGRKALFNSSVTLALPEMQSLVDELKQRYSNRVVIFDLPPALVSDDVLLFLPYLDCGMCVVDLGTSNRQKLERAIEILSRKPLLGTVLNDVPHSWGRRSANW